MTNLQVKGQLDDTKSWHAMLNDILASWDQCLIYHFQIAIINAYLETKKSDKLVTFAFNYFLKKDFLSCLFYLDKYNKIFNVNCIAIDAVQRLCYHTECKKEIIDDKVQKLLAIYQTIVMPRSWFWTRTTFCTDINRYYETKKTDAD